MRGVTLVMFTYNQSQNSRSVKINPTERNISRFTTAYSVIVVSTGRMAEHLLFIKLTGKIKEVRDVP